MKNNTNKTKASPGTLKLYFQSIGSYISKNYLYLILFFIGLIAVSAVNFVKISTVQPNQSNQCRKKQVCS